MDVGNDRSPDGPRTAQDHFKRCLPGEGVMQEDEVSKKITVGHVALKNRNHPVVVPKDPLDCESERRRG